MGASQGFFSTQAAARTAFADWRRVETGQPAAITLNAFPDRRMPGRVVAIIPTADRAKATVKVRVGFEQRDGGVLPEMGARVAFLSKE